MLRSTYVYLRTVVINKKIYFEYINFTRRKKHPGALLSKFGVDETKGSS